MNAFAAVKGKKLTIRCFAKLLWTLVHCWLGDRKGTRPITQLSPIVLLQDSARPAVTMKKKYVNKK